MWIGQEATPVPIELVNFGVVGVMLGLVLFGQVVPRHTVDRLVQDKERLIAERDRAIAEQGARIEAQGRRIEALTTEVRDLTAEVRELRRAAGRDP